MALTKGEEILLAGLSKVAEHLGNKGLSQLDPVRRANSLIDATLNMYETEGVLTNPPVQWNPAVYDQTKPLEWFDEGFKDFHPAVRGTTYMEVHDLLGTAGSSPEHPYWTWSVCGVITSVRGRQVVCPNDWILEASDGFYIVLPDAVYKNLYKGAQKCSS